MASSDTQPLPPALILDDLPFDPTARRVEIDEFIADDVLTNLFFLALHQMKDVKNFKGVKDDDWFSFYNLASIHGFPLENWRGVKNTSTPKEKYGGYYCTHGSTVFPTWHRLYVHMFEQVIFKNMSEIAASFQGDDQVKLHQDALKRYRFPYWDPCLPRTILTKPSDLDKDGNVIKDSVYKMFDMPRILKEDHVYVKFPDGKIDKIPNPLISFNFPTEEQYASTGRLKIDWENKSNLSGSIPDIEPYGYGKVTRTPGFTGKPNEDIFTFSMRSKFAGLTTSLYQMLHPSLNGQSPQSWTQFANHIEYVDPGTGEMTRWPNNISLESWHDDIHDLCGEGLSTGHMGVVPVAAFDPIFWLHHNNIDRIFALWQALYEHQPNSFVPDTPEGNDPLHATSELAPFVREQTLDSQKCYNSNDVKSWKNLGFAIPGNAPVDEKGRKAIQQYIMNTYNWQNEKQTPPSDMDYPKNVSKVFALTGKDYDMSNFPVRFQSLVNNELVFQTFNANGEEIAKPKPAEPLIEDPKDFKTFPLGTFEKRDEMLMNTWCVLMRVKKYAFNSSFTVNLFLGQDAVPTTSEELFTSSSSIGFSSVFAFRADAECENCTQNKNLYYTTVIPITPKLRDCLVSNKQDSRSWPPKRLRRLESLHEKDILPFLTAELRWRISTTNGEIVTKEQVDNSNLELLVAHRSYQYPDENRSNPMGTYSGLITHPEVTRGQIGGVKAE